MAATTTTAPTPVVPRPTAGPDGSKLQSWYIDSRNRRVKVAKPLPVDADDHRTAHRLNRCRTGGCTHEVWLLRGQKKHCPDHGTVLAAPADPDRPRLFVKAARQMHGASAYPWLVLATAAVSGPILQAEHVQPGSVAPVIPVAAAAAYLMVNRRARRRAVSLGRIAKGQRSGRAVRRIRATARRAAAGGALTGGWLTLASVVPPHGAAGAATYAALAALWAAGSYPWWAQIDLRRRRGQLDTVEPPTAVTELFDVDTPDPVRTLAVSTWGRIIGPPNGPLGDTELVDFARLPACMAGDPLRRRPINWSATVRAKVPGSINMREVRPTLLGRIAAAYGVSYGDVSFAADQHDLSKGYLRVCPDNGLAEVRMWPGTAVSNWARGTSTVGQFDDGTPVTYVWWNSSGAAHELISGCSGSGKSELVVQLILTSLHSDGLVVDWLADPQRGQSYGELKDQVDWFAGDPTEIKLMLLAAVAEMYRRNDVLSAAYQKTWRPTRDMPLLVLTLDELQAYITDPQTLNLVEQLAGMARKVGIKLRGITQVPAAYALGDSIYIKEQLVIVQRFIFRAATNTAGHLATDGDTPVDPTKLPTSWGPGTCGQGETTAGLMFVMGVHGRDVFGRSFYTGDEGLHHWLHAVTPGQFGGAAAAVSGVLWGGRQQRRQAALGAGRNVEDLLGGKAAELLYMADLLQHGPLAKDDGPVNIMPTAETRTARNVVLAAARDITGPAGGSVTKQQIVEATPEVKAGTRDKALTDLLSSGDLDRIPNATGQYFLPPQVRAINSAA